MDLEKFLLFAIIFYYAQSVIANSNQEFDTQKLQPLKLPGIPLPPSLKNQIALARSFELYTLKSKSVRSDLCREQSDLLVESTKDIEAIKKFKRPWGLKSMYC